MSTAPTQTGLDQLVEEAMQRKLVPGPTPANPDNVQPLRVISREQEEQAISAQQKAQPEGQPEGQPEREPIGQAPDATFYFTVNGVKCYLTIHVEPGATVTTPTLRGPAAPKSGPKVKGVRGRTEEANAAPEASEAVVEEDPHMVEHPVVGLTKAEWVCPEHGVVQFKKNAVTGREYLRCPECGKLAPK